MMSRQQTPERRQHGHKSRRQRQEHGPSFSFFLGTFFYLLMQMLCRDLDLFGHMVLALRAYLERYILLSLYSFRKPGSRRSLMNRIASPVDFISGPSSIFTPGNLLKLNTGSLMANPSSFFSKVKSVSLFVPNMILVATLR